MKKFLAVAFAVIAITLVVGSGSVFAQSTNPPTADDTPSYFGMGRQGGRGMMGGGLYIQNGTEGPMHDAMIEVFSDQLGLSVDEINTALAEGKTLGEIALEQGLTVEEFQAIMLEARDTTLENAVAEGLITEEQADWMSERGSRMMGGALSGGTRFGRGGSTGGFYGRSGNPAGCPMFSQVQ